MPNPAILKLHAPHPFGQSPGAMAFAIAMTDACRGPAIYLVNGV